MCLPNPSTRAGCDSRSTFKRRLTGFEFRVFLLLVWLPYQGQRAQSLLRFSLNEKIWIQTFSKSISNMWNINGFVQELNSITTSPEPSIYIYICVYVYACVCMCVCAADSLVSIFYLKKRSCPRCNGYRRRKWTRRHEFKSWTRLIAFHIALIPLGKVWIQLFSFQLWVNSRTD